MKHVNAGVNIDNSHFYKKTILILWVEKWLKTPLLNDPECCKANTDVESTIWYFCKLRHEIFI